MHLTKGGVDFLNETFTEFSQFMVIAVYDLRRNSLLFELDQKYDNILEPKKKRVAWSSIDLGVQPPFTPATMYQQVGEPAECRLDILDIYYCMKQ